MTCSVFLSNSNAFHYFFKLAYEAKLERQHRRKEKNRECSRNFRYKQRLKEDCLKRGKLEKEVFLRRYHYNFYSVFQNIDRDSARKIS